MDDPHVIARVDRDADDRADDPAVRQRLWPGRIHLERRDLAGRRRILCDRHGDGSHEKACESQADRPTAQMSSHLNRERDD